MGVTGREALTVVFLLFFFSLLFLAGCYENRRRFAEGSEMEGGDMLSDGEKRSDRRRFLEEKVKKEVTQR